MRLRSVTVGLLVVLCVRYIVVAHVQAAEIGSDPVQVEALILFGDSTTDVGNNNFLNTIAKSNFPPYGRAFDTKSPTGRFTDGRLVSDYVATRLGLPLSLPALHPNATGQNIVHGINFASASSGYLDSTSAFLNVMPTSRQLQLFDEYKVKLSSVVGPQKSSSIISEALYIVSSGSNDFILNYFINLPLQRQYTYSQFHSLMISTQTDFVKKLYDAGARNIGIFGLPPLGCIPMQITLFGTAEQTTCVEDQNAVAMAYNNDLQSEVSKWQASLPGSKLLYLDSYTLLYDVFTNPLIYGYKETRRACCGEGMLATATFCNANSVGTCSDASNFVFFDSLHPTQSVYKRGADHFHEKVVAHFNFKGAF